MAPELKIIKDPKVVFKKCSSISNSLESSTFPPKWWTKPTVPTTTRAHQSKLLLPILHTSAHSSVCSSHYCINCKYIQHSNVFKSSTYNKTFKIQNSMNCGSANLVYLITCSLCNIQYVGETGDTLRNRMNRHRSNIHLNQNTAIAIHFNSDQHNLAHLSVIPIELIINDGKMERLKREYYWQLRLGTIHPKGLNNYPIHNDWLTSNFNSTDSEMLNNLNALLDEDEYNSA